MVLRYWFVHALTCTSRVSSHRWQNRRIVVTGSVPPFDEKFAEQIAAQPQIDEGDFLTAVVRPPPRVHVRYGRR